VLGAGRALAARPEGRHSGNSHADLES
jgi:hypothetical protein